MNLVYGGLATKFKTITVTETHTDESGKEVERKITKLSDNIFDIEDVTTVTKVVKPYEFKTVDKSLPFNIDSVTSLTRLTIER